MTFSSSWEKHSVKFYGILTIVSYLNIDCEHILLAFLNEPELIFCT